MVKMKKQYGKNEKVSLSYKSDLNDNEIADLLKNSFQKDMILQFTSCGIHKDDLIFKISNSSIKRFGSQGQQKSFLISLRFAEFEFLKNNKGINYIKDSSVVFFCDPKSAEIVEDHTIIFCKIDDVDFTDNEPLIWKF